MINVYKSGNNGSW